MNTLRLTKRVMSEDEIKKILLEAKVGRLGLCRGRQPYIVPLNFAYENGHIFVHCADTGKKMDFLKSNSLICFEVDEYVDTLKDAVTCNFDTAYKSVIVLGNARILTDIKEKTVGLKLIVAKYAGIESAEKLKKEIVDKHRSHLDSMTVVIDITIEQVSGKRNGV